MGKETGIEWTDKTFNPWIGCARVSPGCENCYAEADQDNRRGRAKWGIHGTRSKTSDSYWMQLKQWNAEAKKLGIRYKVFCSSLCDILEDWKGQVLDHNQKPLNYPLDSQEWVPLTLEILRDILFEIVEDTPWLDYQFLTKRIENASRMFPKRWYEKGFPANVWVGSTIEDQTRFDDRIRYLSEVPAVVRFISYEPALGPIKSYPFLADDSAKQVAGKPDPRLRGIQWVICGGESGPNARPMHPDWARNMRDQCLLSGVAFFFKQWGEYVPKGQETPGSRSFGANISKTILLLNNGEQYEEGYISTEQNLTLMKKTGKKEAGALLDGKEHKNFPELSISVHEGFEDGKPVHEAIKI